VAWSGGHMIMELEHGNEDHGYEALGDGQEVKLSRQWYNYRVLLLLV